jgi:L-iditol 2-dehydrogenase
MAMADAPIPEIVNDTDVLIRVARVGVCGSDIHYYADGGIGNQRVEYPWVVGHEGAGVVVEVGSAVRGVKLGDRVAFDPSFPCGTCEQCLVGRPHTCLHLLFFGCPGQVEGCLKEYIILPERGCLHVPDTMTLDAAAMMEPLSIAVYGATLYPNLQGATIAILGSGPIGLCLLQTALSMGAKKVYVTDKIDQRLDVARRCGAAWTGNPSTTDTVADIIADNGGGLDGVFECCGKPDALDDAVKLLKPGGELSLIGIPEGNRISMDINLLRRKEIRIQNVRRQNNCMQKSLNLIESGAVDANAMITHRFPFARTDEAYDLVANYRDGVVKAMISLD